MKPLVRRHLRPSSGPRTLLRRMLRRWLAASLIAIGLLAVLSSMSLHAGSSQPGGSDPAAPPAVTQPGGEGPGSTSGATMPDVPADDEGTTDEGPGDQPAPPATGDQPPPGTAESGSGRGGDPSTDPGREPGESADPEAETPPPSGEPGGAPGTPESPGEKPRDIDERSGAEEDFQGRGIVQRTSGPFPSEPAVGGFVIEVSHLSGSNLFVDKEFDDTAELERAPQARIRLRDVELRGLNLFKNLTTDDGMPFHLRIETAKGAEDTARVEGWMEVRVSELYAKRLKAKALGIVPITLTDYWTTEPENDLLIRLAGLLGLVNLEADTMKVNAHKMQVRFDKIVIPNLVLTVGEGHLSTEVE